MKKLELNDEEIVVVQQLLYQELNVIENKIIEDKIIEQIKGNLLCRCSDRFKNIIELADRANEIVFLIQKIDNHFRDELFPIDPKTNKD